MRFQLDIILYFVQSLVHFLLFLTFIQCTIGSALPDDITVITTKSESFFENYQLGNTQGDLDQKNATQTQATPHLLKASGHVPKLRVDHLGAGLRFKGKHRDPEGWLAAHNAFRTLYGAPKLTWSEKLARAAKMTTDNCVWKHTQDDVYGENIAAGQESSAQVVHDWVNGPNEKNSYDPENPNYSHFTQVIWKRSTQVGCALTTCTSMQGVSLPQSPIFFWACEYNPPGNVVGEFNENVQAGEGGSPL